MKLFQFQHASLSRFWLLAFSLFVVSATVSSCDDDDEMPAVVVEERTLVQRLQNDSEFSTLTTILTQPAYADLLAAASNPDAELTIFAPTNAAFTGLVNQLGLTSATQLPEAVVRDVLEYHIVGDELLASEITAGEVATLQGENITITTNNGVQVNGIAVTQADIDAVNGVIHKIGGVLLPEEPSMVAGTVLAPAYFNQNFSILVEALRTAGLVDDLLAAGPFTVFAPTNDAFAAAGITSLEGLTAAELQPILLYHVVAGEVMAAELSEGAVATLADQEFYVSLGENGVFINGTSEVTATDIDASNGVIHVIDQTLLPPTQNIVEMVQTMAAMPEGAEFTQLLAAVLRVSNNGGTNLVQALSSAGPFTVFAPTDAAFQELYAALGVSGVDDIPVATLEAVLLTHVLQGRVFSTDLMNGTLAPLQSGQNLLIDTSGPTVAVEGSNSANILVGASDALATNGVVHVIDQVLLPN